MRGPMRPISRPISPGVLEDNLNTVENLKKMTSKSSDNFSMITLEFEYGSDLTEAANDIRDAVSRTQSLLPTTWITRRYSSSRRR